jgi:ElaB/YqjD/DUF883 family membrane-anchored ribosome-binding protein
LSKVKEAEEIKHLEQYVKELTKDMDKNLADLKVQLKDVQRQATRTFTRRPMLALAVAFVAGMAFGVALSKSSD